MTEITINENLCKHNVPCTDSSYATCPHCSRDLCLEHLIEHQQIVRLQFNELIDRINEKKAASDDHSTIYKIRDKMIADLDECKAKKTEMITTIYNEKRTQIEKVFEQCVIEKANIQSTIFQEINTPSNTIEKKKHVHPHDIQLIEQKLKKLSMQIETLQKNAEAESSTIVKNTELSDVIELKRQLHEAQASIARMLKEHRQTIHHKDTIIQQSSEEMQRVQQKINKQDLEIIILRQQTLRKFTIQ